MAKPGINRPTNVKKLDVSKKLSKPSKQYNATFEKALKAVGLLETAATTGNTGNVMQVWSWTPPKTKKRKTVLATTVAGNPKVKTFAMKWKSIVPPMVELEDISQLSARHVRLMRMSLNQWDALIPGMEIPFESPICGTGRTLPAALRDLADSLEFVPDKLMRKSCAAVKKVLEYTAKKKGKKK